MIIKFTDPSEFLQEVEKDRPYIERKIVRLTTHWIPSKASPSIFLVSVVSTAKLEWGDIIRLEKFVGDYWRGLEKENKGTLQKKDEIYHQIEEACKQLDLEVRAGVYEEGGD